MESHLGAVLVGHHEAEKHPRLARVLGKIIDGCLYAAVVLTPLIYFPFIIDSSELAKQSVLLVIAAIGLVAWVGQALCLHRVSLARSWMHLVVVTFLVGYAGVSIFSQDRYLSFVGNFGQMQWAVITMFAFVVFYGLIVNVVKGTTKLYHLILAFLASSLAVGLIGLIQMVGLNPFGWMSQLMNGKTFNTVGTINALGVYMAVPLVLATSLTVLGCRDRVCVLGRGGKPSMAAMVLVWATLGVSLAVAIVVDYWVVWATILFGTSLLVILPILRARRVERPIKLITPSVLVGISVVLLLFKTPINLGLPSEISPSASATWGIARSTLQANPLTGSGPGTWIYEYAKYRSQKVNLSEYWTVRFERGLTAFLTLFAMIGLVGMALWLMLLVSAVVKSATHLTLERDDDAWQAYLTVFTGWATVTFVAFFYNYNVAHHFVFWFLLALLASLITRGSILWDVKKSVIYSSILSFGFIVASVVAVSTTWLSVQRIVADVKYAAAVNAYRTGKPVEQAIEALKSATLLNRWNDVYIRNLSQAYLIQTSQILQGAPDKDRATQVNMLVGSAIDVAQKATEIAPANVDNWFNFARVLRAIASFTRGADEKAIQMYQEALKREPNNPAFLNEIGQIYLMRADAYQTLAQSTDPGVRKDAEQNIAKELDKAAEALNQSIQVKSDYAEAHYNLGLVYERQGRVPDAISRLEQALRANTKDVGIGFQLAILYYRNNEKDRSFDLLKQIVSFDPSYSNARWYLASMDEERGLIDDAIAQIEEVKKQNPGNTTVEDRLKALLDVRAKAQKPAVTGLPAPVEQQIGGSPQQNAVKTP